jgi:hypothetical protein
MENIPAMTKSTFEIKTDPKTGLRFVTKAIDEPTQKRQVLYRRVLDQNIVSSLSTR